MEYTLSWDDDGWILTRVSDLHEIAKFDVADEEIAVRICLALNNKTL